MPMFTLQVTQDDGAQFTVPVESRDAAQWEKRNKGAVWAEYERNPNIVDTYRLGHIAAVRRGLFTGTLAEFEQTCDFEFLTEEPEDPTQSAA